MRAPLDGKQENLGMSTLTLVHVVLSVIGIASGFLVLLGMFSAKNWPSLTALFLGTTILTSVTGFFFPFHKLLPSHILGILSLIALAVAGLALYGRHLAGGWRRTYVISVMISLYFNVFVLIAQAFMKVPALHALAPTQTESAFKIVQGIALLLFIIFGVLAVRTFRGASLLPS
jgi:hypothetical protein